LLLLAYPKEFRDAYGAQMLQVFRDQCRAERRRSGALGLVGLWVRTLLDLGATAIAERSRSRAKDGEVQMKERRLAGAGFVLVLAPLLFVSASLLRYELGIGSCSSRWSPSFLTPRRGMPST
jgi:hypothetical protein